MATKSMMGSFCEHGALESVQFGRRKSKREERRRCREDLRQAVFYRDAEELEEVTDSVRTPLSWWYDDFPNFGISFLGRWLDCQVGKSWDEVYSKLCVRVDRRSFRGKFFFSWSFSGMVKPQGSGDRRLYPRDYYVDDDGILQKSPERRYKRCHQTKPPVSWEELEKRLAGRKIGRRGAYLYWFVSVESLLTECTASHWNCSVATHTWRGNRKYHELAAFRQLHRLNKEDRAFFQSLPRDWQEKLLKDAPSHNGNGHHR